MTKFFKALLPVCILISGFTANAQHRKGPVVLDTVNINTYLRSRFTLPDVQGTYIMAGKKSEVINPTENTANLADKTARQVFAKIPGIFVYDMDGAGNQLNISARGLDPHRGWEFNLRKDGVMTNSDMYAYPASHYSMPLESIEKIELVRGTAALQYGAQFGGRLNYVTKQGDTTKPFSFESINTIGSFNLVSTYNAIGGKTGKFKYYAYVYRKSRDGYRHNEHTKSEAEDVIINYEPSRRFSARLEWARSRYNYRIPGPLTDQMFLTDPRQATRSRNYFNPDIHVPSITLNWHVGDNTSIQFISSAVLGKRSSVQFDKPTNIPDTINALTLQYNNRQVDIDAFHSYTNELRLLQQYSVGDRQSAVTLGVQYMNNDLHRTQMGKGTTGSDYDLTLVIPGWGRDIHLKTSNIAVFAENNLQLTKTFAVNTGVRIESGETDLSGTVVYYPDDQLPVSIEHNFPLFGGGFTYKPATDIDVYGGIAQAYHPMLFKDLVPSSTYEKVDPDIQDADGYNAEVGFRGKWKFLRWDVSAYLLQFNNRFGTLVQTDNSGALYTYRTNVGNSLSKGIEMYLQGDWMLGTTTHLSWFTSTAFMHACYTSGQFKDGNNNVNVKGNKVESAPDFTTRNGMTIRYQKFGLSALYSYTSSTFADALNTVVPAAATGAVGLVPSYGLLDVHGSYRVSEKLEIKLGCNNATNKQYFTKRPTFYPGPGVWPSEGRSFNGSVVIRI